LQILVNGLSLESFVVLCSLVHSPT
jgi:hypothetical protein